MQTFGRNVCRVAAQSNGWESVAKVNTVCTDRRPAPTSAAPRRTCSSAVPGASNLSDNKQTLVRTVDSQSIQSIHAGPEARGPPREARKPSNLAERWFDAAAIHRRPDGSGSPLLGSVSLEARPSARSSRETAPDPPESVVGLRALFEEPGAITLRLCSRVFSPLFFQVTRWHRFRKTAPPRATL